ncbi:hypothetical protein PHYBLDRAFT_173579 [Phycomyces blakesleeanus NRRL 1555(-)]|uniref:Ndc10 domain-containing protein n=1 Tax=Phycomyces blakesleeanus (strain ATCC 8743b / DSM 1359 / FGSC 10004 / NBRC 33097 / NRRL 1555) TaxID=763407 RepID=A0A167KH35_PHYB8|nr:hypothetical protein PHYBLDRAFT_173579 [Phycomyces blakesleeanus NRRL 1555(-)]OAD68086.1 hypothetical protein PHYBLDRAFT_173579 [Phycomyces blakesleeanus NRRL 1555(-)]|eukprot:XP_018286126.1 hypothetical protein PHYBLDRAFT_173579 [Phycomyces blakesleeanus NRRL 1555(-)]
MVTSLDAYLIFRYKEQLSWKQIYRVTLLTFLPFSSTVHFTRAPFTSDLPDWCTGQSLFDNYRYPTTWLGMVSLRYLRAKREEKIAKISKIHRTWELRGVNLEGHQYLILETHTKLRAPQMNNGNNTTVNDPSLQHMMDDTSAMYSSNQLVLAQNLDQRPTNTTKAYLAKQEEWRQWCLKKEFGDGELVNDQKLSFFMMDHVMNRGHIHYDKNVEIVLFLLTNLDFFSGNEPNFSKKGISTLNLIAPKIARIKLSQTMAHQKYPLIIFKSEQFI